MRYLCFVKMDESQANPPKALMDAMGEHIGAGFASGILGEAGTPQDVVQRVWRDESARLVGALTRMTRDLSLAEDLAQDALVAALQQWPESGVPANPAAWLMQTAKRRAVDQFRRADTLRRRTTELGQALTREEVDMPDLDDLV